MVEVVIFYGCFFLLCPSDDVLTLWRSSASQSTAMSVVICQVKVALFISNGSFDDILSFSHQVDLRSTFYGFINGRRRRA